MKKFSSDMDLRNVPLATDEIMIKQVGLREPEYTTLAKLFAAMAPAPVPVVAKYKEYTIRLYQAGTTAISPQDVYIDDLSIEHEYSNNPLRRFVTYERSGVGIYSVKVKYLNGSASAIDASKLAISFSDRKVEVYQKSSGGDGTYSFAEFGVKSYTPAGVLSDGMINWTNITLKLYV